MEGLHALPSVTRLSKSVVRILGQNPGEFTLQGTNTYLVGEHNPYILIDTGDGREEYIPVLESALREVEPESVDLPDVSDIIVTHKHHDHAGGLPLVLPLLRRLWGDKHAASSSPFHPPRIHKLPLPSPDTRLQGILDSIPAGSYTPAPSGGPIHDIHDSQTFQVTTASVNPELSVLQVLHTPGHTLDSLCLYFPADRALFTADTVLGYGSAVFEDLGMYMASLRKMIDFGQGDSSTGPRYGTVYPGHGPAASDGLKHVSVYLQHRVKREEEILAALQQSSLSDNPWTTWKLVSSIYSAYPRSLWEPAAHSVDLHLRKLESEGRVEYLSGVGKDTEWEFIG
ncbi:Metallo-hydrolase/oxidoreductase [Sparassis latifolia]|uniref:Lactamase-like protein n=1 Tax=Sparassis crispa TaxID=139825 RepID=A0A401GKP2_9APHY|nr:Lactamase-like protein [Sparassis crispa]GBE82741.1 Lactamase-like protein [Sparassis crispa]